MKGYKERVRDLSSRGRGSRGENFPSGRAGDDQGVDRNVKRRLEERTDSKYWEGKEKCGRIPVKPDSWDTFVSEWGSLGLLRPTWRGETVVSGKGKDER